jgi:hypothetical protein
MQYIPLLPAKHIRFLCKIVYKSYANCVLVYVPKMSRAAVVLHRQRPAEDLQQLLAWYKIRDMLLGCNCVEQDIKKALELASVCDHPNAVWLAALFGERGVSTEEEARQVFLGSNF